MEYKQFSDIGLGHFFKVSQEDGGSMDWDFFIRMEEGETDENAVQIFTGKRVGFEHHQEVVPVRISLHSELPAEELVVPKNLQVQDLLKLVAPEWRQEFLQFIETGEASAGFLEYLEGDQNCREAVQEAANRQAKQFQVYAKAL